MSHENDEVNRNWEQNTQDVGEKKCIKNNTANNFGNTENGIQLHLKCRGHIRFLIVIIDSY